MNYERFATDLRERYYTPDDSDIVRKYYYELSLGRQLSISAVVVYNAHTTPA